ncbi:glycosyltransferase family 2 protein [Candidatus Shapirobacteria bacterium]|nr:glycosyltransferase family 2 protein [Candidatus Shapirobacteria bacterium]
MTQPQISFIIINYNGAIYLPRLLKSISDQSESSHETIVVDNGSTDDSIKILSQLNHKFKLVKSTNIGYGRGCNLGASKSIGKFFVFLNPDTYLDRNYQKNILTSYNHSQKKSSLPIGCLNCIICEFDSKLPLTSSKIDSIIDIFGNPRGIPTTKPNNSFVILGSGLFISHQVFRGIGGFNPNFFLYGEELDLCWRLVINGYRNVSVDRAYIYHLGSGSIGKQRSYQLALMTYGSFLSAFTNYQATSLIFILPVYTLYLIFLALLIPIYLNFNTEYDRHLFKLFKNFIYTFPKIYNFRYQVQKQRTKTDFEIHHYLSLIPTAVVNLYRRFTSTNTSLSPKNDN